MSRRTTWIIATLVWTASQAPPESRAQKLAPDSPEAVDEARERQVMGRFLGVLEKAPRRGTALDRVYGYHVERGSLDGFLKTYRDKVAADPNDGASWLLIGLVEAQRGRDSAAVEALRRAEAARPDDPLPAYYLGQALVLVGQPDSAAEAFERALSKKPARVDLLEIYQALGRVHQRAHRDDKALAVWDRLEKAFPDDPRVQEQIAHALADESQDAPALARFEALAKSTRDRFRQVQFAIEAAELKVRLGKSTAALADFETLLTKLDPESWLYREVRRKVEDVFLRTDDLAGLASYYERWISKTPDDVEAMARLGRTLAGQGRAADARVWLDKAIKLAPSRREIRLALIEQLVQDRKFAEAAAQYEALAKLEPNNPDVVRDWGRMLLRDASKAEADRKKAAAAVWRRLAPDDAKDAVAVAQAADLFRQANLADEAIALYLKAIRLAPEATQYREYLGEYYHALKRPADALATWRGGAEGPARNARTLGRLGEVLAGFGYRKEAVEPLVEACKLDPDDFDLRLRLADLKLALDLPLEALPELEKAEKVASADEQAEAVLERLIRAYQASGTLAAKVESLKKDLAVTPTAAGWTRLARLLEAEQKPADAALAIGEATKIDPRSVPAWVATARLREAAGDLLGSAEALRTLTNLDRRSRTDYLTGIAKLEARLGRRGPALEAGRELLAAAPGNPDHHQFFAELCFQLGEPDEGLDALRRAARANPSDPKAMLTLAENLARQFRAEEAIELYWRAFTKTPDVEGKLSIVARMADQYLQRNQLDRLLGRLERELREPNQQRELSLCLAQAHAASGDYGTARLELERLLSTNARDTQLLLQLSNLAEQEGDVATAAKYQKQATDLAPTPEGTARLAQLYLRAGEYVEAESIWTRTTEGDQDPGRALSAIDSLLASGKREAVLVITGRLLRTRPDDWELLYREGVALAGLNRSTESEGRFRAILALKGGDDDKGVLARSKGGSTSSARPAGTSASPTPTTRLALMPIQERTSAAYRARLAAGVDGNANQVVAFSPLDFGQARASALAWLLGLAQRENKQDSFQKERREARDKAPSDPRTAWDWYYAQVVRQDFAETFEAARSLAKLFPSDASAQWAYLASLGSRTVGPNQPRIYRQAGSTAPDPTPALPGEEVDRVLACYRGLQKRRPDLAPAVLAEVLAELKRANRPQDADQVYREAMASTVPGSFYASVMMNAAVERGDLQGLLAYLDKLERAPATGQAGASNATMVAQTYGRSIGLRGVAKAYPDVLSILDRFLASNTRARANSQAGSRGAASKAVVQRANNSVAYWISGQASRGVAIDFPTPNEHHDVAALGVIRTAFEVFRRDDLVSDLLAHLQARADGASGPERVDLLLALGYCRWWNDEKEEAERAVARAVELAGPDPSVKITMAELFERQGSLGEALAAVDSVDAIDSATVLKRENLALRLAVAAGNVDRARKAAERLFGLRLDAEAQVQLAALMGQLGMHDLAEAVMARARKSAGNKPPALLILMNQYQRQQKTDLALQIALQILRLRPMSTSSVGPVPAQRVGFTGSVGMTSTGIPGGAAMVEDDFARSEAMQVLSRSGKLKELVARAEAQLERSPNSMQILQTLAEYARISNDRDKARALYERMAKTRPDDARLRLQLALQLVQAGDTAGALDHYRAAVKADPSTLGNQFFPIMNAFRQADKIEEFASLVEGVDLRAIGNSNAIMNMIQNLMNDPRVKDQGLAMFRKIWTTFPAERASYINLLNDEAWWGLPEVYAYARDVVIPAPDAPSVRAWSGVDVATGFGNDGRVSTVADRLLDAAARLNKIGELEAGVRKAITRNPGWSGGKVLLTLVLLREEQVDEASSIVRRLMGEVKEPMPMLVRWVIGQALEDHSQVQDLAEELYEAAMKEYLAKTSFDPNDNGNGNPSGRLLTRYRASGRISECRDLILKLAVAKHEYSMYDPAYSEAQRVGMMGNYAQQLIGLGFPGDAVGLYREQIAAAEAMGDNPQAGQYINKDYIVQQGQQGIQQAIQTSKPEALPSTVASLLRPGPGKPKPGEALDLLLSVPQAGFEKEAVAGGMVEVFRKVAGTNGTPAEVSSGLASLLGQSPDDFAVNVAAALVAFAGGKPAAIDEATARLARLVERMPLETMAAPRPNSRQRADAARQLGLWLVARECWARPEWKARGEIFIARSLEAARRQADPRWASAMLRELGSVALDRGDREAAERRWSELLDLALARPGPKKAGSKDGRPSVIPATPREGFDKALALAKMAAERGLTALSVKAVREAFRGGPPVGVQLGLDASNVVIGSPATASSFTTIRTATGLVRTRRVVNNEDTAGEAPTGPIEAKLAELEALWVRDGVDPRELFEVLRDVVLPPGRPSEVDLYPLGLGLATARNPKSMGERLASRAVRAGATDELRAAVRGRSGSAISELSGLVILARLDLTSGHPEGVVATLDRIETRLRKDTLKVSAELAAHAALPALRDAKTEKSARALLEQAIKNLSALPGSEPLGSLMTALAGHDLDLGRLDEGRKRLRDYIDLQEKTLAQTQNNPELLLYYRRGQWLRVAAAFARRGLVADALDVLGRYADVPTTRYAESSPNGTLAALARSLPDLPPEERYRLLKDWTFPTADRKSLRTVVGFLADSNAPPAVFASRPPAAPGGVVATPLLLIEAASRSGKLDELAGQVRALEEKSVEESRALLALVEIARGKGGDVLSTIEAMAADLEKPVTFTPGVVPQPALGAALVARACLLDERLAAVGERLANALIHRPWNGNSNSPNSPQAAMVATLRRDLLRREANRSSGRDRPIGTDPGLASWVLAESGSTNPFLATVQPAWFEHEGHVGLSSTSQADLALACPLAGSFEFSVETSGSGMEGASVSFGGRPFASQSNPMFQNGINNGFIRPMNPEGLSRAFRSDGFNRVTLRVEPGRVRGLINGIVVEEDTDPDPTSPWLALTGNGRATWRSFEIQGNPEVPREVRLSHADRLGGWSASAYAETIAPRAQPPSAGIDPTNLDAFDWYSREGEIRGRKIDETASVLDAQSRLAYARPLLDGESVSYSFLHEPGRIEVHPSLGRLAFLLEKDGVRLHWMTDGPSLDPSGLLADNAVDEPASRRKDGPLPLKPNAWNSAKLSISRGNVTLELNGEVVFERPVGSADDRTFGLFHFKDRTAVRVRDVVLRGDWPEKFEATRAAGLLARSRPVLDEADRRADHALVGEGVLVQDAGPILRRTRTMAPAARFEALAAWVLPGPAHPTFRLQGDFTPLDPAPPDTDGTPPAVGRSRAQVGGEPESTASDLVEVARASGKLDELAGRIESAKASSPVDERGRLALLAMVRLAEGRDDEAIAAFARLKGLAGTVKVSDPDWMRWPELTAAWSAFGRPKVRPSALAVLEVPTAGPDEKLGASDLWVRQVRQARAIGEAQERGVAFGDAAGPSPWAPVRPSRPELRGRGFPRSSWSSIGGVWSQESGTNADGLLLRIPLRGDFEASIELSATPGREANLAYAGLAIRVRPDRKSLLICQVDDLEPQVALKPPLEVKGEWSAWKIAVREGRVAFSIDGRVVIERPVPAECDPWLTIEAPGPLGGSARNLVIAGRPVVPEKLRLSALSDLVGWSDAEYPDSSNGEPAWRKRGDEIVGRWAKAPTPIDVNNNVFGNRNRLGVDPFDSLSSATSTAGSSLESVLRYRRPILEDGEIEYEFFFEPGKAMVHPTLDRLAFLINPDGVSLHRLTDLPYERAGLVPGNVATEPARRRGPASPPIRPKAWNRLKLTLVGDVLALNLNDVLIYERPVEPTNARTFGLFHFADESEARVRNVTYRGAWPRAVPDPKGE